MRRCPYGFTKISVNPTTIPAMELRILCATVLDAVKRFYEDPVNAAGFERWLAERKGGETDGQKDDGVA